MLMLALGFVSSASIEKGCRHVLLGESQVVGRSGGWKQKTKAKEVVHSSGVSKECNLRMSHLLTSRKRVSPGPRLGYLVRLSVA